MKYLIGIDAGTSNVKAVLFDENGKECAVASRENKTITGANNSTEQDMNAVWESAFDCLKELARENTDACKDLAAIGLTGQGEGFWAIDKDGNPVQNAIIWRDGRAVEEVEALNGGDGSGGRRYHEITGTPPLTGGQMMVSAWMVNHRREVLDRTWKVFFCKDWIRYKLTGEVYADFTDSMTTLMDMRKGEYAYEVMEMLGLSPYRDLYPEVKRSDEIVGTVTDEMAEAIGLPKGIPVITGALDTSATAVGLGAVNEGSICVILGTTCAVESVLKKEDCAFGAPATRYEKHPRGNLFFDLQPTNNGTPNIDWMVDRIAGTKDFSAIDEMVASVAPGCGGVIYLPYISLGGERAPFYHPYARASFFGISEVTEKAHLIRAVYEGISLSLKDCLRGREAKGTVYLAGGGAKSPVWAQMIANVLGTEVVTPSGKEQGAKGAMMMAGIACGVYKDYDDAAARACSFERTYQPEARVTEAYAKIYELFVKLRTTSSDLWNERHQLNKQVKQLIEKG